MFTSWNAIWEDLYIGDLG
jgi:hypothetical protein